MSTASGPAKLSTMRPVMGGISERFGWFVVNHLANASRGRDWRKASADCPENRRFARGARVYTERVGGSSPSPPTIHEDSHTGGMAPQCTAQLVRRTDPRPRS